MLLTTLNTIEKNIKKYAKDYALINRAPDLAVQINCSINEENKEILLNELDTVLPYGIYFSHEYKNGHLKIVFKEV